MKLAKRCQQISAVLAEFSTYLALRALAVIRALAADLSSIPGWCRAGALAEDPDKVVKRSEAVIERDLEERRMLRCQRTLGGLHPLVGDIALRRKTDGLPEEARKVEGTEACLGRKLIECKRLAQVSVNVIQDSLEALRVERTGHRPGLPAIDRIVLDQVCDKRGGQAVHEQSVDGMRPFFRQAPKGVRHILDKAIDEPSCERIWILLGSMSKSSNALRSINPEGRHKWTQSIGLESTAFS